MFENDFQRTRDLKSIRRDTRATRRTNTKQRRTSIRTQITNVRRFGNYNPIVDFFTMSPKILYTRMSKFNLGTETFLYITYHQLLAFITIWNKYTDQNNGFIMNVVDIKPDISKLINLNQSLVDILLNLIPKPDWTMEHDETFDEIETIYDTTFNVGLLPTVDQYRLLIDNPEYMSLPKKKPLPERKWASIVNYYKILGIELILSGQSDISISHFVPSQPVAWRKSPTEIFFRVLLLSPDDFTYLVAHESGKLVEYWM